MAVPTVCDRYAQGGVGNVDDDDLNAGYFVCHRRRLSPPPKLRGFGFLRPMTHSGGSTHDSTTRLEISLSPHAPGGGALRRTKQKIAHHPFLCVTMPFTTISSQ